MCGIAGVFEREGVRAGRPLLEAMAGELRHRGPDGVGMYLDGRLGMVNTRLSIVDLSGGDQPIGNETGRFWVMQNGEIYNHPELRAELEAAGHVFTTHCDTEVLVHAYEQWGEGMLRRLIGAFAIAIWDREKSELFLARDRLGIRPLFLADCAGALLFASEAKALLRHEGMQRVLDPLAMLEVFTLWGAAPERSAFEGVRELAPGTWLRVGADGRRSEQCWWRLEFAERGGQRQESADVLKEELLALLTDATRLRLRADVPVGAYLSGGLDSSAIAALVRRETTQELRSFAVRFADRRFDEREHQDRMAAALGTQLQAVEISGRDVAEVFPEVIRLSEKPMFRTAPAPLLLLSRLARANGFKVVLTGEGADEMFAGYNIFKEAKIRRFWARQPQSQVRPQLLRKLYPYLGKDLGRTGSFLSAFFGRDLDRVDEPLFSHGIRYHNGERISRLFAPDLLERALSRGRPEELLIRRLPDGFDRFTPLARAQYLEIHTFLQGYLLHSQGDRMLMGNSVEGRFPFLDHRIAEFAARLPDRLRLCGLEEKHLLRRAVSPLLPAEIAQRQKRPYRAPILHAFLGPDAPGYVEDVLAPARVERTGLFSPSAVSRLLAKCRRGLDAGVGETDEMGLVGVISSILLHDQFVDHPVLAAPLAPSRLVVGAEDVSTGA